MLLISYVEMHCFAIAMMALILFQSNKSRYGREPLELRLFNWLVADAVVMVALDTVSWMLDGASVPYAFELNHTVSFVVFYSRLPSFCCGCCTPITSYTAAWNGCAKSCPRTSSLPCQRRAVRCQHRDGHLLLFRRKQCVPSRAADVLHVRDRICLRGMVCVFGGGGGRWRGF